jgi:DNA polymerase-3 subunit beta
MTMQIEVNRHALMRGLLAANSVVERRTTVPILSSLLMRANGSVELIGTDLDMERRVQVPIADGKGAGEYLIEDPRSLLAVLKQASSKTVQLTADPEVRDERMQWCAGVIKTRGRRDMDPGDFPMMHMAPQFARATVGADFLRAVRRVFPAIGTEETRYYLNGMAMRHLGGWSYRLATTDGHRLHIAQVELPDVDGDQWPGDVIIPRRAVLKLMDIVAASDPGAVIDFGSYLTGNASPGKMPDPAPKHDTPNAVRIMDRADMIVSKLIDGTFPDVMRVVPAGVQTSVRVKTSDLRRAVAAASAGMVARYSPAIRIAVGGQLTVSSTGSEGFETSVTIDAEASSGNYYVGFNGNYLVQALDALGGQTTVLQWDGDPREDSGGLRMDHPCKLIDPADDKFFVVLMPMRV